MLVKNDPDIIKTYFEDSSNLKGGYAQEVALPHDVEELSAFVKDANLKKIPITISGGGTGTTGSRIPFGGVVISMEKFNKIHNISKENMSAVVQAGVLVDELKSACEKEGLFYTSHPTEGTASVGGTVATNASGSRSFKYGPTRKYVRRLKMVLANGEVLDLQRGEHILTKTNSAIKFPGGRERTIPIPSYTMPGVKNSAGYFAKDGMDLIDLFIGQEGTLSIIVDIELALVKKPLEIFSCFIFFKKEMDAWGFCEDLKNLSHLDTLSIEYLDSNALKLLRLKNKNVPPRMNAVIFFEQEIRKEKKDLSSEWLKLISRHKASVEDTWVAMNEKENKEFTKLRHAIPEAVNEIIKRYGFQKLSTDIAVPDDKFRDMMDFYIQAFEEDKLEHVIFGHIGESHLHVNILPKSEDELERAKRLAFSFVKKGLSLGGTVSAEHGIGKIKHKYLEEMYGKRGISEMVKIKKVLDPNFILGLGNIFPREVLNLV